MYVRKYLSGFTILPIDKQTLLDADGLAGSGVASGATAVEFGRKFMTRGCGCGAALHPMTIAQKENDNSNAA